MIYFCMKFHTPGFNWCLPIAMKERANEKFRTQPCCYFTSHKKLYEHIFMLLGDLLPYSASFQDPK
jgi:hypothetical protein